MNSMKKTCEECTKAKVKCTGSAPCERCAETGQTCVFRPARKRGPPPGSKPKAISAAKGCDDDAHSEAADPTTAPFESSRFWRDSERHSWKLFFAAFKFAKRAHLGMAWYKTMLLRFSKHLHASNQPAAEILDDWVHQAGLDLGRAEAGPVCEYAPTICTWCTSVALGVERMPGAQPAMNTSLSHGEIFGKLPGKPWMQVSLNACKQEFGTTRYDVNDDFVEVFGITSEALNGLVQWTGTCVCVCVGRTDIVAGGAGLLPWGSDALTRVFAAEFELLSWLQVLALKFHALGFPTLGSPRVVPMVNLVEVRLPAGRVSRCLVRAVYRETIEPNEISFVSTMTFELVGEPWPQAGVMSPSHNDEALPDVILAELDLVPEVAGPFFKWSLFESDADEEDLGEEETDLFLQDVLEWVG
jgi:hypothetical protein